MSEKITVETQVEKDMPSVWNSWTSPEHIIHWNFASHDWICPHAENNLKPGGRFSYRMEAKDGSGGFDFSGEYLLVDVNKTIEFSLDVGRKTTVRFSSVDDATKIEETFDADKSTPLEMQKNGWQAILDNFKKYTEGL